MPIKNSFSKEENFTEKVKKIVQSIPKGEVRSYGDVAKLAGSPRAYRAVASIMANNFDKKIPCHRVIRSDGKVGEYNRGGEVVKLRLLRKEGWMQ